MTEQTFSILKPDATARNLTGAINKKFEENGLRIVGQKRIHMTREQAEGFYAVQDESGKARYLHSDPFEDPVVLDTPELREALLTASDHFPVSVELDVQGIDA